MKLSIGILAYNESDGIEETIKSLCEQDIFHGASIGLMEIQVICVPNGCTDDTATVATAALERWLPSQSGDTICSFSIRELKQGDKSNAWNQFVHEFSDQCADFICLMDADILYKNNNTIRLMINKLLSDPLALVATDLPEKSLPAGIRHSWFGRLSMASSAIGDVNAHAICGQLYISRATTLRNIWIPPGLPVEDGFVRACVVTDCFRSAEIVNRVARVANASHKYTGCVSLHELIRHQQRLVIGSAINFIIFNYLRSRELKDPSPILQLRAAVESDASWLSSLIREGVSDESQELIPISYRRQRWRRLRGLRTHAKLLRAPVVFIGWIFDEYITYLASRRLKRGEGLGYW